MTNSQSWTAWIDGTVLVHVVVVVVVVVGVGEGVVFNKHVVVWSLVGRWWWWSSESWGRGGG